MALYKEGKEGRRDGRREGGRKGGREGGREVGVGEIDGRNEEGWRTEERK